ncbi:MAG: surface-adhesin E family protein [Thermodesulfovibrionales bacterium]
MFIIKIVFFLFFSYSYCHAENAEKWMLIVKSQSNNDYYIDLNSISYTNYHTVIAWYKVIPEDKASVFDRFKHLRLFGFKSANAQYFKVYCEIDCRRRVLRFLVTTVYDADGGIVRRDETLNARWTSIPRQSTFDMIRDVVCKSVL